MDPHGKSISQASDRWSGLRNAALGVGAATLIVALTAPGAFTDLGAFAQQVRFQPHAPDFSRIAAAPAVVQVHLFSALTALAIGVVLMMRVKGTTLHKLLGWTWVLAMGSTAVSSLFIREINHGAFSFIHLLSGWTIIGLPGAVYAIKRGKVSAHRKAMTGMFVGGLLVAGLFTFLPGRLLWTVFLG
ncbi:DUF2306 domain-containing protein [Caulobacter vibrioides]|uniref:DUF2306 domain-containing protein n=1 Tax=Caulobacter vibrioides TaxID=155892 RepID=UPI000BB518D9|nr:DUF2306 domain-containing protein [Caulobacter vibrioides]ATC26671.1 DUF2306 domain-containing protein [Caulobacter vibrioides]AZH11545.1 DUF2306 domain-containing protein [Caulobacter vibrioides]PLR12995.1 DUF2306 domain-containing protein [Caulobacter vibrioides]